MPFLQGEQTSSAATVGRTRPSASERADDDLVGRWLIEYTRLRDAAAGSGTASDRQRNDLKARLARHYTALVESVARRFLASGESFDDLVQEGFLGLLSALEHYDLGKGVKFSTYATHFIAGAIRHCLRDRGKIIKEPAWLHELYGKIHRATDALTQQLGRPPDTSEIARQLNLTEESVEEVLANRQIFQVAAFSSSSDEQDDSMVGLVDPEKIRSDHYVTLQLPIEDRIVLEEAAVKLKALEQKVLHEFFYKDLNQTEIARKFGISCNYVSHILKNSTQKLRRILGEADVRDRARNRETSSIVDSASGLFTAAHIQSRVDEELSRAARAGQNAALLVVELEGMPTASLRREEAWAFCGEAVRKTIRRMDIAGRWEGDSLVIFLPETSQQAGIVAERLTEQLTVSGAANHIMLSVRVGVALYPVAGRNCRDLAAAARREEDDEMVSVSDTPILRMAA